MPDEDHDAKDPPPFSIGTFSRAKPPQRPAQRPDVPRRDTLHNAHPDTHPAFAKAWELQTRKAQDYGALDAARKAYFPFGDASYATMMHTKMTRVLSLLQKDDDAAFEPLEDTVLDLINYAAFYWAFLQEKKGR